MSEIIDFRFEYRFLSNFTLSQVTDEYGVVWINSKKLGEFRAWLSDDEIVKVRLGDLRHLEGEVKQLRARIRAVYAAVNSEEFKS